MARRGQGLMHLPELNVQTGATVDRFPMFSTDGFRAYVVVIKEQYAIIDSDLEMLPGAEIRPTHVPWPDDDAGASVMYPGDIAFRKPSTDVILAGSAVSNRGPVPFFDVSVQIGSTTKSLQVSGARVWYGAAGDYRLTDPLPIQRLPLRWEYAFGGMDLSAGETGPIASEWRNPVGRGIAADPASLANQPGPQIEDPVHLISNSRSRPPPAGVAAIGPSFEPRLSYAGTYDDAWTKTRMPLLPTDFDERYYQDAAPDMVTPSYLTGGETIHLLNIGRPGATSFVLPRRAFAVQAETRRRVAHLRVRLDTLLIRADDEIVELTWRVPVIAPSSSRELRRINVFEKKVLA